MVAKTVASRKARGRNLQNFVVEKLRDKYCVPNDTENFIGHLREDDIKPILMGGSGVDITLSPFAKDRIPFDIECKNQESWSIPSWWKQTLANTEEGRKPLLVIKKNRQEPLVVMRFSDWLELL